MEARYFDSFWGLIKWECENPSKFAHFAPVFTHNFIHLFSNSHVFLYFSFNFHPQFPPHNFPSLFLQLFLEFGREVGETLGIEEQEVESFRRIWGLGKKGKSSIFHPLSSHFFLNPQMFTIFSLSNREKCWEKVMGNWREQWKSFGDWGEDG